MSKTTRKASKHSASERGGGASLAPRPAGPVRVEDLGMDVLAWVASELGVPMSMVMRVLKADPSLLEGVMDAARSSKDVETSGASSSPSVGSGAEITDEGAATSQPIEGLLVNLESPMNRLFVPEARPRVCKIPDSEAVRTTAQFTIEMSKYDIRIYNSSGQQITRIWGDPHVNENGGGDNWHFGNNSTFVLTDGTKICLDTEQNSSGEWLVEGIDIIAGHDRYHFGTGDSNGLHKDAQEWDRASSDVAAGDKSAGLFALKPDGTWAMQGTDGHFYDVKDESWSEFQGSEDVNLDTAKKSELNELQQYSVLYDHLPEHVNAPRAGTWDRGPDQQADYESMKLIAPQKRPSFLKHKTSALVQSPLGYIVEMQGTEVIIWDFEGKRITRIWGDPHVNEKNGGDNWHFGGNSTFILPDGTKIRADTEPLSQNFWVVRSVDVTLGASRFHYSGSGGGDMHSDARKFDKENTDADNRYDAGIFALTPSGEWAIMARDGRFYDIADESWAEYQKDPDVDLVAGKEVKITTQQQYAARSDQLPSDLYMPAIGDRADPQNIPSGDERREKMAELAKVLPSTHMSLLAEQAPDLLPSLAEDLVMAEHIANMPIHTLTQLLQFAPGLIVQNPHRASPEGAVWPPPELAGRAAPATDAWWRD